MRRILALAGLVVALALPTWVAAGGRSARDMFADLDRFNEKGVALLESLTYEQGTIALPQIGVRLEVPEGFYFLNNSDANRVLTEAWGNPIGQAQDVVGMIFPATYTPIDEANWGATLIYEDDGHIDDTIGGRLDPDALLAKMRENVREANVSRQKSGFDTATVVGWAALPTYDRRTHKLTWARELAFSSKPDTTINYSVRYLGRSGLLSLTFVAKKRQLPEVRAAIPTVLAMAEFVPGARYEDFNPAVDKTADYGIAQLITGVSDAPPSTLARIWSWVQRALLVVLALVGIGAGLMSWSLKRRRETSARRRI